MVSAAQREHVPVSPVEQSLLTALTQADTPERQALTDLAGDVGWSRAAVAQAVLGLGIEAVRARARESGYAALAASYTAEEVLQRREEIASRRERAEPRWQNT